MKRLVLFASAAVLGVGFLTGADSCTSSAINTNGKSDSDVQQKMSEISLGASEYEVRSVLGEPNHTQQTNTSGYQSDCRYTAARTPGSCASTTGSSITIR
jgi:hypothetical protein